MEVLGVPFDVAIVAGDIGSYKPAHRHWEVFREETGADRLDTCTSRRASSTTSLPRRELGIPSIWINRLGEYEDPRPAVTLNGIARLADALDAIVPASA